MNLRSIMRTDAGWGIAIIRVVTGIIFVGHGAPKFGFFGDRDLSGVAGFLGNMGVPLPSVSAFLLAFFETFGGAFLIIGVLTRVWSAGLAFAMLIAATVVHWDQGLLGNDSGPGYQWALLLMACSLALLIEGAGKGSLDRMLSRR